MKENSKPKMFVFLYENYKKINRILRKCISLLKILLSSIKTTLITRIKIVESRTDQPFERMYMIDGYNPVWSIIYSSLCVWWCMMFFLDNIYLYPNLHKGFSMSRFGQQLYYLVGRFNLVMKPPTLSSSFFSITKLTWFKDIMSRLHLHMWPLVIISDNTELKQIELLLL